MPKVSVIIPTYNRAHFLSKAIESVLQQTFGDFELIIVDDGSIDNTNEVVASYHDRRIIYYQQEKQEKGAARNRGVALSQGEYITFLDDDDWYMPRKLEIQTQALDERPDVGMVISGWDRVDEKGNVVRSECPWLHHPQPVFKDWLFAAMAHVAAVLIRRDWFQQVSGFDDKLLTAEDTDLWFRLALAGCPVAWVKEIVFKQRLHGNSSVRNIAHVKSGKTSLLNKIFSDVGIASLLGISKENAYARVYLGFACLEYASKYTDDAKADLARATELDPALLENKADPLFEILGAYAWNHMTGDPVIFTNQVFSNLPSQLMALQSLKQRAMAKMWLAGAFRAYQHKDMNEVRRAAIRAVAVAPSLLLNRGLVSILTQSVIGSPLMNKVRGSKS